MAKIDITDKVTFDRDTVYETFRDNLVELLPYLPTVKNIERTDYERVDENSVKIVNIWYAADEDIPSLAQRFISQEMLQWKDTAHWDDEEFSVKWDMEVGFLSDAISCGGKTTYKKVGDQTEVHILGDLKVDAKKIPGVPRLIAGKVGGAIEKFVVKMITPNMKEANRGVEKYLATLD